jgi:threonine/homoserine/homoserine lactone efflux protein
VPGEVGLVVEADADGDVGRRPPVEQLQPGHLNAPADSIGMGGNTERPGEAANQVSRACSKLAADRGERHRLYSVCIQQGTKFLGEHAGATPVVMVDAIPEVVAKPLDDKSEMTLRFKGVISTTEQLVDGGEAATKGSVRDDGPIDRGPNELVAQHSAVQVQHSHAVSATRRGSPVVRDVGWQQGDHRWIRSLRMAIEVVPNGAVIHDEQRPGAVRVGRVGVAGVPGVKDLADAGHRRPPGPDLVRSGCDPHARIVQDPAAVQSLGLGNARRRSLSKLPGLVAFAFVSSVTPGPNNTVLWASGAQFGFRPTLPHVIGTSLGIGAMASAVAAGLGFFVTDFPQAEFVLRVGGSLYLLYLAYQITNSGAISRPEAARPLSLGQAIVFQCLNPKAWIFVLAAVSVFRPADLPIVVGYALVILTMMLIVFPTAAAWAAGGTFISRVITNDRARRALSFGLAVVVAAMVVDLWI